MPRVGESLPDESRQDGLFMMGSGNDDDKHIPLAHLPRKSKEAIGSSSRNGPRSYAPGVDNNNYNPRRKAQSGGKNNNEAKVRLPVKKNNDSPEAVEKAGTKLTGGFKRLYQVKVKTKPSSSVSSKPSSSSSSSKVWRVKAMGAGASSNSSKEPSEVPQTKTKAEPSTNESKSTPQLRGGKAKLESSSTSSKLPSSSQVSRKEKANTAAPPTTPPKPRSQVKVMIESNTNDSSKPSSSHVSRVKKQQELPKNSLKKSSAVLKDKGKAVASTASKDKGKAVASTVSKNKGKAVASTVSTSKSIKKNTTQRSTLRPAGHIMWEGFDEPDIKPVGHQCLLCADDLAYSRVESDQDLENYKYPEVSVLACGDAFHMQCLENALPVEQLQDPKCFRCASRMMC